MLALTAALFEGEVNPVTQEPVTWLTRNLVLVDKDLVDDAKYEKAATSLNLRGRHLEYAILTRSDLHKADLTGARLQGAVRTAADLREARLTCPATSIEIEDCTQVAGAILARAQLQGTDFTRAQLSGADLSFARLQGAALTSARLHHARLAGAQLQGANLSSVQLRGAHHYAAKLQGAYLVNCLSMTLRPIAAPRRCRGRWWAGSARRARSGGRSHGRCFGRCAG
jgi:uncharacterized protein YjbI with pentapeptide repeats